MLDRRTSFEVAKPSGSVDDTLLVSAVINLDL